MAGHVEGNDFRPHVTVIAGRVTAEQVAKISREPGIGNVAERRRLFEFGPGGKRIAGVGAGKLHVESRQHVLAGIAHAGAEAAGLVDAIEQFGIHRRTVAAMVVDQRQWLRAPGPLLEHLRRCFDEVLAHVRAGQRRVVGARQGGVQQVAEFVEQRLQLVVVEALGVEIGDQHANRCSPNQRRAVAYRPDGGVVVLARPRLEVEVGAGDTLALVVEHVVIVHALMPDRDVDRHERHTVEAMRQIEHPGDRSLAREVAP